MRGSWLWRAALLAPVVGSILAPPSAAEQRVLVPRPRTALSAADDTPPDFPLPRLQPPCGAECADYQPPKPILNPQPDYRSDLLGNQVNFAPEGFVLLRYVVGTDGKTHDITPIMGLGIPRITDMAVGAVKGWTFTPAMRGGKPVAQMMYYRQYLAAKDKGWALAGGHSLGVRALRKTMPDPDEAREERAQMEKDLAQEQMTFTARAEFALPLIGEAEERKDYLEARRLAVMVSVPGDLVVGENLQQTAWAARVDADLALGEVADAILALRTLKHFPKYRDNLALTTPANEAIGKALASPQMLARAVIPSGGDAPVYWHALYRNTFKFAEGTGTLDRFSLMCDQNMMEAPVSFTAQWRLPSKWRNCVLFVTGAPGATFGVIETADAGKSVN
jgi:hypothetical protein